MTSKKDTRTHAKQFKTTMAEIMTEINNNAEINNTTTRDYNQDQDQDQLPPLAVKDMDVILVQDVSGSMVDQRTRVVKGINEIISDLKKRYREPCPYRAHVRIIKFSSNDMIRVGERFPVHDVPLMNQNDLICDGMTALWDATAITIDLMNKNGAEIPVTTYVFSDGDNNDSVKHTQSEVNEMIAENKRQFPMHSILFIGSDPSTKRNAAGMGLGRMHSIQHDSNDTPVAYEVCRRALARCVSGDTQSTEFNEDDIVMSETPSHEHDQNSCAYVNSQLSDDYESDDVPSVLQRTMSSK